METITCTKMDDSEFEGLVKLAYGIYYEFAAAQEASNNSYHLFKVGKGELSDWQEGQWYKFICGEPNECPPYIVLWKLYNDGFIPEGNYLIYTFW